MKKKIINNFTVTIIDTVFLCQLADVEVLGLL